VITQGTIADNQPACATSTRSAISAPVRTSSRLTALAESADKLAPSWTKSPLDGLLSRIWLIAGTLRKRNWLP
jgi:hypothetical protein